MTETLFPRRCGSSHFHPAHDWTDGFGGVLQSWYYQCPGWSRDQLSSMPVSNEDVEEPRRGETFSTLEERVTVGDPADIDAAALEHLHDLEWETDPGLVQPRDEDIDWPRTADLRPGEIEPAIVAKHTRLDVYHHFPGGIPVTLTGEGLTIVLGPLPALPPITILLGTIPPPPTTAVSATLRIINQQGEPMPDTQLSVDLVGESVEVTFKDDKGDVALAPDGASVTFASSDPAISFSPDASGNAFKNGLELNSVATGVILTATLSGANDANGNAIPDPAPSDPIDVVAGAAASASLSLEAPAAPPAPAPADGGATPGATGGDGTTGSVPVSGEVTAPAAPPAVEPGP